MIEGVHIGYLDLVMLPKTQEADILHAQQGCCEAWWVGRGRGWVMMVRQAGRKAGQPAATSVPMLEHKFWDRLEHGNVPSDSHEIPIKLAVRIMCRAPYTQSK